MTRADTISRDRRLALTRTFEALCDSGPTARSELHRRLRISPSTVTGSVQELRERQLIADCGQGRSTGGRQPMLLDLHPQAGAVLAIDVGGINLRAGLADLRGELRESRCAATPCGTSTAKLRSQLQGLVDAVVGASQAPLRAIAVSVAGIVHPDTRLVSGAVNLPHFSEDLLSEWLAPLRAPVLLDNEANLAALGEHAGGAAQGHENVLFLAMGAGIGAGIVIDGHLFRGHTGAAGEIGFTRFGAGREQLEQLSGAASLQARHKHDSGESGVSAAELFARAAGGEGRAAAVVDGALDGLALGLANAVCLLDPEMIVLGGGYAGSGDWLIGELSRRIEPLVPSLPRIVTGELGPQAALIGAAQWASEHARARISEELDRSAWAHA